MATYDRTLRVDAPLSEVWALHSDADGLRELTPDWVGLRVESIIGPDGVDGADDGDDSADHGDARNGDPDTRELVAGTRIRLSVRPFGVGPRQSWTSTITAREEREGVAYFVDEMVDGPVPRWRHAHLFYADGDDRTLIRDRVEYDPPLGIPPAVFDRALDVLFRIRHDRTREWVRKHAHGEDAFRGRPRGDDTA